MDDELSKTRTRSQEEQAPQDTPTRKRQIDSDNDDEPQIKRARLTRKNLTRFNKMTKKKAPPKSTDESSTTKTISTTATGFAIQAYKNGILDPPNSKPPKNLEDIRKRLAESRATASPPESQYEDYVHTVGEAPNEATMVFEVGGELLKKYDEKGYKRAFSQQFTGFPKDVGFNKGLSAPQPDFVEGLRMQDYRPFPADEYVSGAVLYKNDPHSITLPHVAGEWKGPDGSMNEAELQSRYDGAALVYARNKALSYLEKSDPPGHANITTFTTDGKNINFFTHYATPAEDGTLEYHQYPIKSMSLVNSHKEHKDGRRGLRNEQDHAKIQSFALRDQLKEHWKQHRSGLHPIIEGVPPLPVPDMELPVTTNAHEDEGDYEVVEHQPVYQPTPPTSSKPKNGKAPSSRSSHSTTHSSRAPPPAHDYAPSTGQKRKASHSQRSRSSSSKYKGYWKKDPKTGGYYHQHSNGAISWLGDDEDDDY